MNSRWDEIPDDDAYNEALKIPRPGVSAADPKDGCTPSQQVSPEAASALREVDREIAARLRGDTPCL
jgi:hypothetical protein